MNAVSTLSIAGLSLLHWSLPMLRLQRAFVSWRRWRARAITKIRRIQIVLARDADQGEQCVAAGVGQRGAHALGVSGFSYRADRPIGGDPLPGGMGKRCRQIDHTGRLVDSGCLYGRDLVLTEGLAHDV